MAENLPAVIPRCPVCGASSLEGAVGKCPRCDTPQHQECTEYQGGCAIFGCVKTYIEDPRVYKRPCLFSRQVANTLAGLARLMCDKANTTLSNLDDNATAYQKGRYLMVGALNVALAIAAVPVAFMGMFVSFYATVSEVAHRQNFEVQWQRRQAQLPPKNLGAKESQTLTQISSRYDSSPTPEAGGMNQPQLAY